MDEEFNPKAVERAAQASWAQSGADAALDADPRPKFYACSMLPYPSGRLHMGHARNYTINDMLARQMRMRGFNAMMPMGWDAFGLPAENAAMKNGVPPAAWTRSNIAAMREQMKSLGLSIDWSREIASCDPSYYKWNQWLFLRMLKAGICERRTQMVNWDPVDKTVLANEQVIDGRGWRSGALVERREIPGYYLKISDYAEELLGGERSDLSGWPERVKVMQANWIGKSQGARVSFPHEVMDRSGELIGEGRLHAFTTRADTLMGVSFCAVAPEHPLAKRAGELSIQVANFIASCKGGGTSAAELARQPKRGIDSGLLAFHPLTKAPVPIWIANYVLMGYGEGAVMGVPAHDERDFAFAQQYGLPITQVIEAAGEAFDPAVWRESYAVAQGARLVNSGPFDGVEQGLAAEEIVDALEVLGRGERQTRFRLRDWGISRQRYWGTPIPIIHCDSCGEVPVPEADLPVRLPEDLVPDGSGNPLATCESFLRCACPSCGAPARRETDTMDTFVDSSWYFMRYCDPGNAEAMMGELGQAWLPMDQYIGGIEHAILHLLYARFWTKVMRDLGLVGIDEPFKRLLTQGMVLNDSWKRATPEGGVEWFAPSEVEPQRDASGRITGGVLRSDGTSCAWGGMQKMSKSERNGVDPSEIIEKLGADAARFFIISAAPPEQALEWSDSSLAGASRFLRQLWAFCHARRADMLAAKGQAAAGAAPESAQLRREVHGHLSQVAQDFERMRYNTCASGCIKMLRALTRAEGAQGCALREGVGLLLRALFPICPHICHALWEELDFASELGGIARAPWPVVDAAAIAVSQVEMGLQINGRRRGSLWVAPGESDAAIEAKALASPEFAKFSEGRPVSKVIIIPGRMVSVVA